MRWLAVVAFLLASPAWAQTTVLQSGPVVAGHVPTYVNSGNAQPIVTDSGTAAGGSAGVGLKELGVTIRSSGTAPFADAGTGPNGENICDYDGPTTGAYHYLCLSPNADGGALISTGAVNGATAQPLQFLVNGVVVQPATSSDYTAGASLCYDLTTDSIVPCPTQPGTMSAQNANAVAITGGTAANLTLTNATLSSLASPLPVASGGTGVASYGALSTAMGLGTMSTQNASGVAITGGAITGMSSPTNASDVATKSYVDATTVGLTPLAASRLITIAALATNTYANGALGVGATLTATGNGALSINSVAVAAGNVVVVNNEVAASHNGIYTVTATGDGSNPYVLTRATYFDQAAEMVKNAYTTITAGSTQTGTSWILSAAVATVGTDPVTFNLFSSSALNSLTNTNIFVGNSSNIATAVAVSGDATMANTGALTVTKTNGTSFATSATTDTTVATNITSGTLPAARLPNPSASTLGGTQSAAAVSHQFINSISTSGVPALSQPAFTDISGTAAVTQGGTGLTSYSTGDLPYASGSATISKLGIGTTGQVLTVTGGVPAWGSSSGSNLQTFTTAGTATWTKPASGNMADVQCWGAGGSGGRINSGQAGGGAGGSYTEATFQLSALGATETVTVGAGGAAITSGNTNGNVGGNTTFGSHITAYGGGGGASSGGGGGGGGQGAAGSTGSLTTGGDGGANGAGYGATTGAVLGSPANGVNAGTGYEGGGGAGKASGGGGVGGSSIRGGAGGGGGSSALPGQPGGKSVWGGAGGGGANGGGFGDGAGGTSIYGGNGGAANHTVPGVAGSQPGGGGGAASGVNSGKGGDGECIITTF